MCLPQLAYVDKKGESQETRETDKTCATGPKPYRSSPDRRRRLSVQWKEFGVGEYRWQRFVCEMKTYIVVELRTDKT